MTSIHRRLTATLLATVLALATATGLLLYFYVRARLLTEFDQALLAEAKALAASLLWEDSERLEFNYVVAEHPEFQPAERPDYFCLQFADGRPFARSASLGARELAVDASTADSEPAVRELRLPDGERGRCVYFQFAPHPDVGDVKFKPEDLIGKPPAPVMLLEVASDRHDLDRTLWVLRSSLIVTAAALAVGTLAAVAPAARHALRPLHRLAAQAEAIDAESLGHRFDGAGTPRELKPIVLQLNQLLSRLAAAFERERRFTADVSHELRTPIAELRSMAEVALRWPADTHAEQIYADTLTVAKRMEKLVATLLAITRHQAERVAVAAIPIDLGSLTHDAWRGCETSATDRDMTMAWNIPSELWIVSDETLLRPLLANLLSNAVSHGVAGSEIEVRGDVVNGVVRLAISNTCEGLTDDDIQHLAEPFWRKDASRAGDDHYGLGLTLVATYARSLGLTVRQQLESPRRFTASIELPAAQGAAMIDPKIQRATGSIGGKSIAVAAKRLK